MWDDNNMTDSANNTSTTVIQSILSTTMMSNDPLSDSDAVSPVTLSVEWSRVARLLIMIGLSVIGSIGNVYMISSVMIEDHLNKRGNTFLANVALADLLISGLVIPASAIVILAGLQDSPPVCQFQWFISILSFLVTVMTMIAIAGENYIRLCLSPECYAKLTVTKITILLFAIWILSSILVTLQFFYQLGPNYCAKKISGIIPIQVLVAGMLVLLPLCITAALYLRITYQVHVARMNPSFKPPLAFNWDYSLMLANAYSFIMFLIFWSPFAIVMALASAQKVSAQVFYNLAWLALSKSCFNNLLYCAGNRHFRNAYVNLFHYCCCKTTVTFSRRARDGASRPSGDVRVHIIPGYNMYSYTSPTRSRESGSCPLQSRPRTRANGNRDVYEL
ncbi:melatonin receptor type 1B-B-like [Daktulosphaira vitifoliae]|uniref:melatonin receptor type 1B-B-like n=1 Tax=Daktulosphaira vitifoliae TaxID=58002 RepID=UPI0021AA7523|nr:melatonin receptor type 1B-B-like [Daktulosphaira vitifoliae]XP_050540940.1 melatonin receptor type 1B-B-like [Daktulosphaira vitifoliae]XP_050540941.1 melatonin receptor type 1B-B-like [Daktulosphaira vitifoliae]XP_050540942.1 melatonin receptor type 1B-B-like [Daktulosphaira vitifoliae]XP_050540943.1 melatonin receptor type 1B-B-like [Daktulosphaira vitifoliae]XP_050540944.1 melatonin receptor type 1B-B-like [Daktulosphaira vitifoliae]